MLFWLAPAGKRREGSISGIKLYFHCKESGEILRTGIGLNYSFDVSQLQGVLNLRGLTRIDNISGF
jgi:hypothetical protein